MEPKNIIHFIIVMTIFILALPLQRVFRAPSIDLNYSASSYPPRTILPPHRLFPCDPNHGNLTLREEDFAINKVPGFGQGWFSFITGSNVNQNSFLELIDTEKDELLIWKVQSPDINGNVQSSICVTNYKAFKSDETFIIVQTQSEEDPRNWGVHYWIGKDASETAIEEAASNTILIASRFPVTSKIHREVQAYESNSFKALFEGAASKPFDMEDLDMDRTFLIEKEDGSHLREVDPSSCNIDSADQKCLVLVSEKIYAHCGAPTSKVQKKVTERLAKFWQKKKKLSDDDFDMIFDVPSKPHYARERKEEFRKMLTKSKKSSKSKAVLAPFQFRPAELRIILGQTRINNLEEIFSVELTRIYESRGRVRDESVPPEVSLGELQNDECYLIDSHSNAGLFLLMGDEASNQLRQESARKAEQYLRKRAYDIFTPINFIDRVDLPFTAQRIQDVIVHTLKTQNNEEIPPAGKPNKVWDNLLDSKFSISTENFLIIHTAHHLVGEVHVNDQWNLHIIWKKVDDLPINDHASAFKSNQNYVIMEVSLNSSDSTPTEIWNVYYWTGKNSTRTNAAKAAISAYQIGSRVHSTIRIRREVEGHESHAFRAALKDSKLEHKLSNNGPPEYTYTPKEERVLHGQTSLLSDGSEQFRILVSKFFVTGDGGFHIDVPPVQNIILPLKKFEDTDCYLMDSMSNAGIYIWMGRRSTRALRSYAITTAEIFLESIGYPLETPIIFIDQDDIPSHVRTIQDLVHHYNPVDKEAEYLPPTEEPLPPLEIDPSGIRLPTSTVRWRYFEHGG